MKHIDVTVTKPKELALSDLITFLNDFGMFYAKLVHLKDKKFDALFRTVPPAHCSIGPSRYRLFTEKFSLMSDIRITFEARSDTVACEMGKLFDAVIGNNETDKDFCYKIQSSRIKLVNKVLNNCDVDVKNDDDKMAFICKIVEGIEKILSSPLKLTEIQVSKPPQ